MQTMQRNLCLLNAPPTFENASREGSTCKIFSMQWLCTLLPQTGRSILEEIKILSMGLKVSVEPSITELC